MGRARCRLAIIGSRGYPCVYSGYETFVRELAERLVKSGVEVTVYNHRGLFRERPRTVNGVRLVYLPTIERKTLSQVLHSCQAAVHASLRAFDIILVVNPANGPFGPLFRLFGKRTAINVDGLEWLRPKWKGLGARYFHWAAGRAARTYDVVIADSRGMRDVYLREFGVESELISYGAAVERAAGTARLRRWGLDRGDYFLVVGRLIPDNNADLVVREFLSTRSKRKLVIVGDVPYRDAFALRVKGVDDPRLVFTGYVRDQRDLAALYRGCYAYIHGHEFGGTNPTLLTALGCGCAVAALDTVFNREVLDGEGFGLLFSKSPGDLARLVGRLERSPSLTRRLRARGPKRIRESYTWDAVAARYLALFERMMAPGRVSLRSPRRNPLEETAWRFFKRAFDLAVSIPLFVLVFSWLWPVLALAIKLDSPGPVLFKQERWGDRNRRFVCCKFRSMVHNSRDHDENGRYLQARKEDARLTRMGRFLRRTSLDELPQFLNVLRGEMSIVGPRPHPVPLDFEFRGKVPLLRRRYMVRPGITGWAQIHGLRGPIADPAGMNRRVEYDIWYAENWSVGLDAGIILRTLWLLVRGDRHAF
jgi:lipopolysaccharide/colanic/teichoic acid biosynthesis glycosyltransferase/glycosyltransferase involved in cell wall biosynthesis